MAYDCILFKNKINYSKIDYLYNQQEGNNRIQSRYLRFSFSVFVDFVSFMNLTQYTMWYKATYKSGARRHVPSSFIHKQRPGYCTLRRMQ